VDCLPHVPGYAHILPDLNEYAGQTCVLADWYAITFRNPIIFNNAIKYISRRRPVFIVTASLDTTPYVVGQNAVSFDTHTPHSLCDNPSVYLPHA